MPPLTMAQEFHSTWSRMSTSSPPCSRNPPDPTALEIVDQLAVKRFKGLHPLAW